MSENLEPITFKAQLLVGDEVEARIEANSLESLQEQLYKFENVINVLTEE